MLNAILDYPPKNTFTQTQLANQADISRKSVNTHIDIFVYFEKSVNTHIDIFVYFDIILEHDNGEYSMNPDSEILKKIIELEGILNTHKQKNELPDIPTEN